MDAPFHDEDSVYRRFIKPLILLGCVAVISLAIRLAGVTDLLNKDSGVIPNFVWEFAYYLYWGSPSSYVFVVIALAVVLFFSEEIKRWVRKNFGRFQETGTPIPDMTAWEAIGRVLINNGALESPLTGDELRRLCFDAADFLRWKAADMASPIAIFGTKAGTGQEVRIPAEFMADHPLVVGIDGDSSIQTVVNLRDRFKGKTDETHFTDISFWGNQIRSRWPLAFAGDVQSRWASFYLVAARELVNDQIVQARYEKGWRGTYCVAQPTESVVWDMVSPRLRLPQMDAMAPSEIRLSIHGAIDELSRQLNVPVARVSQM